jgi:hypothetical protein
MPFTQYQSIFDPETLQILQEAFDMAWSEVATLPSVAIDVQSARDVIAKRIVTAAQENGELNPSRLKTYALAGFNPRQSA